MNADKGSRTAPADFMQPTAPAAAVSVTAGPDAPEDAPAPWATVKTQASGSLAGQALFVGEALIVLTAAALMSAYGHRRGDGRRAATHAKTSRRRADDRINSFADYSPADGPADADSHWTAGDPWIGRPDPPWPDHEPPVHRDDHPSWPGRPGPYALHPDHPSWPGGSDPRWAATEAGLRADDYPSWPEGPVPPRQDAEPPRPRNYAPGWFGDGGSAVQQEPTPAPSRGPRPQPTGRPVPVLPAPVRTDLAPSANLAPPGPVLQGRAAEVTDWVQPGAVQARPQAIQARPQTIPARPQTVQGRPGAVQGGPGAVQGGPGAVQGGPGAVPVWDAGSAQLASWIISEANQAAAEIRHEARDQAATSLAGAKRDADQLVRQASDQAAAKLAAAELEAAELRATVVKLSGELGGVAAYVTQNLITYAPPAIKPVVPPALEPMIKPAPEPQAGVEAPPAARPTAKPGGKPAAGPKTRPTAAPGTKPAPRPKPGPAATPGARAAAKAKARPRQLVAIRVMAAFAAALFLFALVSGSTEVALHGFRFFVFRSGGVGETPDSGLQENQGPGQADAPGGHK